MIPLFHDLEGERVVVFGGGPVAARKADLFSAEATVEVRSREFVDRFEGIDCEQVRTDIDPGAAESVLEGAFLAIPATDDPSLNDRLAASAREAGVLVNRVDRAGDTVTPSVVAGENVTVGISTGGASPAVCKYLRRRLEDEIAAVDRMVDLQAALRTETEALTESERRQFLWSVLEDEAVRSALAEEDWDRARDLAEAHRP
jgi:precorrin-2 dehydrogenase/sirohydrochlorin ferrochelatase